MDLVAILYIGVLAAANSAELQFKMVWEGQGREGSVEYEFYSFLPRTKVFSSLNSRC